MLKANIMLFKLGIFNLRTATINADNVTEKLFNFLTSNTKEPYTVAFSGKGISCASGNSRLTTRSRYAKAFSTVRSSSSSPSSASSSSSSSSSSSYSSSYSSSSS